MKLRSKAATALLCAAVALLPVQNASACSRPVYFGKEGQTVTGRSMDWLEDMQPNLWIFRRGMQRDGGMGSEGLQWTSRYGSVIASVYEAGTADGMNEKGLVANQLFLVQSEYRGVSSDTRPQLSIPAWTPYLLDSFATVEEAAAAGFSVMRNVSVPRGISTPGQPNIASTIWRTVADQKNKVCQFEDTASPNLVWVRLDQIDFKAGSGARKLTLHDNAGLGGDQTAHFDEARPFEFLGPH